MTPMSDTKSPVFETAIAMLQKPLPADGAALVVISDRPDGYAIWSRGDRRRLLELNAAVARHTFDNDPVVAPMARWIWADLTGCGPRWHLALCNAPGDEAGTVFFPAIGFADAAENYADCPSAPLTAPPHPAIAA